MNSFKRILSLIGIFAMSIFCLLPNNLIFGQNLIEEQIDVNASVKDSIVSDSLDDRLFMNKDQLSKREIKLDLVDGGTKKGYLKQLTQDSIVLSKNGVLITSAVNDVVSLNIIKKKDHRGKGAIIGMILGAIPGIMLISQASNRKQDLINTIISPVEFGVGITLTVSGAIIGGIIGHNNSRGTTITIPINASNDLYKRQKRKIIDFAY
jgi:hypothetical protein